MPGSTEGRSANTSAATVTQRATRISGPCSEGGFAIGSGGDITDGWKPAFATGRDYVPTEPLAYEP